MKVNFYLQDHKEKETKIFLVTYVNRQRLKFYTTMRVKPNFWDKRKQRVKNIKGSTQANNINQYLSYLQEKLIDQYYLLLRTEKGPSAALLKQYLNEITFKTNSSTPTLSQFWQQVIEEKENDPELSKGTVKAYKSSFKLFQAYCKSYGNIDFENLSPKFSESFYKYLLSKNYAISYAKKVLTRLQFIANEATKKGIIETKQLQVRTNNKNKPSDKIYLSLEEIKKIRQVNTNFLFEGYESTLDFFLIQCFTGAAYIDLTQINQDAIEKINGIEILYYKRVKTYKFAAVPLHPIVKQLLKKYPQGIKPITNQVYNRYLKDLGELARINNLVDKKKYKGGQVLTEKVPKFKMIASHTGRRSFVSNYILSGGAKQDAQLMIGHLKQDVTDLYIRAEIKKRAALLAKQPFFKTRL